jgi:outer membrane protease
MLQKLKAQNLISINLFSWTSFISEAFKYETEDIDELTYVNTWQNAKKEKKTDIRYYLKKVLHLLHWYYNIQTLKTIYLKDNLVDYTVVEVHKII